MNRRQFEIVVENIGTVYDGEDYWDAREKFVEYRSQSVNGVGRAADASVTWFKDGEPYQEHLPELYRRR